MQRERPNAAAAPRDRPGGVAVGTSVGRAVASEENCARFYESQGVDKEPVPLTSGLTHEYNSDFPPEGHVRFRRVRNRRDRSAYERENALLCLYFGPNRPRSDGSEALRRQGGLAPVLLPYTAMDDDGLPLSSPLLLSQPAVQAPHDNPDAPPSSESTGGDVEMESSDKGMFETG